MIDMLVENIINEAEEEMKIQQDKRIKKAKKLKYLFEEVMNLEDDIRRGLAAIDKLKKVEEEIEELTTSERVTSIKKEAKNLKEYLGRQLFDGRTDAIRILNKIERM